MASPSSRIRRLGGLFLAEGAVLRQGLVALLLSTVAGFVAGLTLGHLTDTLEALPGLLVLIPAAVGMKGTIFGAVGARLGTAEAAGLLETTLERGGTLRRNADVAILTTFSSALWLALLAAVVSAAVGIEAIPVWSFAAIAIVGGFIGSLVVLALTVGLARLGARRGWDLDSVSTPMVTALGDMTTLPSLFLATFLVRSDAVAIPVAAIATAVAIAATVRLYTSGDRAVRRIALEMTPTIAVTPIFDVIAGLLLEGRQLDLVAVPVLFALIPPFVSQSGALGGIFASRTTSKLQLGVVRPRALPDLPVVLDGLAVALLGVGVYALIGGLAWATGSLTGLLPLPEPGGLVLATLRAGLLVLPLCLVGSYAIAVVTFRARLDPDNQSVPFITSLADLAGVAMVLAVMASSGVLPHG